VLGNIWVGSDEGALRLAATNLQVAIAVRLDGWAFEREGATTLPARLLAGVVGALPAETLSLAHDGRAEATRITCGAFETTLKGIAAAEFPRIPSIRGALPDFRIRAGELIDAIATVACAAAGDDTRPILTGVCLRLDGTRAALAASDGLRLAERMLALDAPAARQELVVPAGALLEVAKAFRGLGADDEVEVVVEDGHVLLHTAQVDVIVRRLEGAFPPYERVIPAACASRLVLDTHQLRRAVRLAATIAASSGNVLRLTIAPGASAATLTLRANAAEVGDNQGVVEGALTQGAGGQVALNARLLADALACIDTAQVALEISGERQPVVVRPVGERAPAYLHVVMPMTLR